MINSTLKLCGRKLNIELSSDPFGSKNLLEEEQDNQPIRASFMYSRFLL